MKSQSVRSLNSKIVLQFQILFISTISTFTAIFMLRHLVDDDNSNILKTCVGKKRNKVEAPKHQKATNVFNKTSQVIDFYVEFGLTRFLKIILLFDIKA